MTPQEFNNTLVRVIRKDKLKLHVADTDYLNYIGRVTVPEKDSLYIYLGQETSFVRVGDGNAYLIDLPIAYSCTTQHMITLIDKIKEIIK